MVAGRPAPGCARGDPSISTAQPSLGRLIPGLLALAVAGAIAAASLDASAGALPLLAGSVGLLGVGALGVALALGWPSGIGTAIALLAAGYLGHLVVVGEARAEILVPVSLGLLLVGESAQWSLDRRLRGAYEPALHVARGWGLAMLLALGAGVVVLGLVATGIPIPGGIGTQAAAVAASVALLALVASVARGRAGGDDRIRTGE